MKSVGVFLVVVPIYVYILYYTQNFLQNHYKTDSSSGMDNAIFTVYIAYSIPFTVVVAYGLYLLTKEQDDASPKEEEDASLKEDEKVEVT